MTRRAWLAFAATSLIWGVPYLFIRIAVRHGVPPAMLAWSRVTIAAAVLLALAWRAGTLGALRGRWRWLFGAGAVLLAAVGYAIGPMLIKHRFAGADARAMMGGSLAIASVLLAVPAALDPPRAVPSAGAIGAVIVLGLLCTAAAFVIFK